MWKTWIATVFLAATVGIFVVTPTRAPAQYNLPGYGNTPYNRPAFSPYLNLNRNNVNPVVSYYGIIRPQIAAGGALTQLQSQQNTLATQQQQQYALEQANALPVTGHAAGFQTQNRYFLTKNAPNAGAGGIAVGGNAAGGAPPTGQAKAVRR